MAANGEEIVPSTSTVVADDKREHLNLVFIGHVGSLYSAFYSFRFLFLFSFFFFFFFSFFFFFLKIINFFFSFERCGEVNTLWTDSVRFFSSLSFSFCFSFFFFFFLFFSFLSFFFFFFFFFFFSFFFSFFFPLVLSCSSLLGGDEAKSYNPAL